MLDLWPAYFNCIGGFDLATFGTLVDHSWVSLGYTPFRVNKKLIDLPSISVSHPKTSLVIRHLSGSMSPFLFEGVFKKCETDRYRRSEGR